MLPSSADDADLEALEHATKRHQSTGIASGRGDGTVQDGQQVGVDLVDDHARAGLRERHRDGGLGHAVGRKDRFRAQSERCACLDEVLDVGGLDLLGARQRPPQRRQVELTRCRLPAQPLGEQRVGEVGRGRHGALVLVNELGPQQRIAQEVHRRDLDQLRTEVHRHGQEARHAHVVEAGQPADDDVGLVVELRPDEHRLGVGHHVAMADLHGLGRSRGAGCQLQQGDVVVVGVDGFRRGALQELLDRHHVQPERGEQRLGRHERIGDDDRRGADHLDDRSGLFGPTLQVGARGRLMQHGQAGAAHPDALGGWGYFDGRTGQHRDGVTVLHAGRGQTACDPAGTFVDLGPAVPNRGVRLAGDHALRAGPGVAEHRVGESTHGNPPDGAADAACIGLSH